MRVKRFNYFYQCVVFIWNSGHKELQWSGNFVGKCRSYPYIFPPVSAFNYIYAVLGCLIHVSGWCFGGGGGGGMCVCVCVFREPGVVFT